MGFNTSAVILNDALSNIAEDTTIGRKIASGVNKLSLGDGGVDVSAGGHCNAIRLVETHHADGLVPILVGCNSGRALDLAVHWTTKDEELEERLLRRLAEKLGYTVHRKPKRK